MKYRVTRILAMVALFLTSIGVMGQEHSLTVEAPAVVAVDEAFRVVFTATGKSKDFTPGEFADFQVLAGPSTSTMSSVQYVNGKRTEVYNQSYTYVLLPTKEGKFTIPPASVKIDGKLHSSKSVTVEVVKTPEKVSSDTQQQGNGVGNRSGVATIGADDLMLDLSVNKKNVIKGEPVIVTLKLLSRVNLSGVEDVKFPSFNGFWSQEVETPSNLQFVRETYNGEIYSAALLRKYVLLPQQTGTLTIDPAEMICSVQVRSSAPSRSVFDDFFESYQTLKKRIHSQEIKINVSSLPAGAPPSFTGGVGDFKLNVSLSRDSLKAHEAASLIVTISGSGNLNLIEAPKLNFPPDFEVYDVKRSEKIATTSSGSTGSKTFEYPFIPRSAGNFTINPVEFSYYSIRGKKYQTLNSEPLNINVARGEDAGNQVISSGVNKQSVKSLGNDIRYIVTSGNHLTKDGGYVISSLWYWVVAAFVVALYFILSSMVRRSIARRADIAGSRNRKAKKVAKVRLKRAEEFLKQELYTAFYEELHKAVLCYLSDKLTIPLSELGREGIKEKLSQKGYPQELADSLDSLIDACEYARYAPSSGAVAMEKHYLEAVRIISEIES